MAGVSCQVLRPFPHIQRYLNAHIDFFRACDLISERQCGQIWPQIVMSPIRRFRGSQAISSQVRFSLLLLSRPFLEAMDAIWWSR